MPPSAPGSMLLFLLVVAFVALAAVVAVAATALPHQRGRDAGRAALVVAAWMGLTAVPPTLGWLSAEQPIPSIPLFLGSQLVVVLALAVSPLGRRLARLPASWLLGFQGFRLPLEIVLSLWVAEGRVPPQMTWTGSNWDVAAGVVALLLAPFAARSRAVAWIGLGITLGLLLNVLRVVVTSFPTPLQRFDEPVLLALSVPEVWIASVCVMGAMAGELLLLRHLLHANRAE